MGKGKSKNRRKVQESPSNNDSPSSAWLRESASSASSLDFEQDNIFGSAAAPSPPHNGNNIMNNEEDRYELLSSKYLALEREMQELKSLLHNSSSSLSFQQEQHHQRQHEGHIQSRAIGDFKGVMQYTFDENKNDNNAKKMDFSGTTTAHETFYDEEYSDLHQKDDTNSHHGNNGDEDEEEMAVGRLNPDSNAFLISAPLFSTPFIMAFLITCGKGIIFCLIAVSLASFGTQRNPLGIPAAIEATVAIGQLFALIITVCTQDDLITALMLLIDGYDQQSMLEAFPGGAYFYKWMLTAASMIGEGIFGMLVTFLLIITASDNVSLLLNFTAVSLDGRRINQNFCECF